MEPSELQIPFRVSTTFAVFLHTWLDTDHDGTSPPYIKTSGMEELTSTSHSCWLPKNGINCLKLTAVRLWLQMLQTCLACQGNWQQDQKQQQFGQLLGLSDGPIKAMHIDKSNRLRGLKLVWVLRNLLITFKSAICKWRRLASFSKRFVFYRKMYTRVTWK